MHYLSKSWSENFNAIINIKKTPEDFPGGPVVKSPHFHCSGGHRFSPWSGELHMLCGADRKKKTPEIIERISFCN